MKTAQPLPVIDLAKEILSIPSVCPDMSSVQDVLTYRLEQLGFSVERIEAGAARHLWARKGSAGPLLVFSGHSDVVSPGPLEQWESGPFEPTVRGEKLFARGVADMKSALACMIEGTREFFDGLTEEAPFSVGFLIVGDEEGASRGTPAVLDLLRARGERIDFCILGEPTSTHTLGDTIKIGRRGSVSVEIQLKGIQGHVGYPAQARNAVHEALPVLNKLIGLDFDRARPKEFEPTSLQITSISAGEAPNIIPGVLKLRVNVRYALGTTAIEIRRAIEDTIRESVGERFECNWREGAEPFLTKPGKLSTLVSGVVERELGVTPELSTSGGTSDGRFFMQDGTEIVELGLLSNSIHGIDEHTPLADIARLKDVYCRLLREFSI